ARSEISSIGASTGAGGTSPVTDTVIPATVARAIGLRSGAVNVRHRDGRAPSDRSESTPRSVVKNGVNTASWNTSTGTASVTFPSAYVAIGSPRLPALT